MNELILIGGLAARHRDRVREFCLKSGALVYAEPLSGLREDEALRDVRIENLSHMNFDSVIRIGNVPTVRFWRDLEDSQIPVRNYSDLPFAGLSRGSVERVEALECGGKAAAFLTEKISIDRILDEEPDSELAMIRTLSERIPKGARIFIGNSLPIREWDLAATREQRGFTIEANRGANGIDGQLSTFFGWCAPSAENWCIVGDLTALYDFNAPWIVPQLDAKFRIVIINNGGGRIFSRVPSLRRIDGAIRERLIENAHSLRFTEWAKFWKIEDFVIELLPDPAASARAWKKYDDLWL